MKGTLGLALMMSAMASGTQRKEDRFPSREDSDLIAKENLEKHYKSIGLNKYEINGIAIWARNYKNAVRKAKKK